MQTTSLIFGILAVIGMIVGFIPCLASVNWLNIPFATVGLVLGIVSIVGSDSGNKTSGIVGIVLCSLAIIFGLVRLFLSAVFGGGGVV
jgi:hypothetical protein